MRRSTITAATESDEKTLISTVSRPKMSSRLPIARQARLAATVTTSARSGTPLGRRTPVHAGISRACAIDSRMRAAVIVPDTIVEKKSSAITPASTRPAAAPKRWVAVTAPIACIGAPSGSFMASGSMTRR